MTAPLREADAPAGPAAVTLGLLAGGAASRLGGLDKASLQHGGHPLAALVSARFADQVAAVLLSANAHAARWRGAGFTVVTDRVAGIGPIAGIDALAAACTTPWLLTVPVDAHAVPATLPGLLRAAVDLDGASCSDEDGPQPLLALWRVAALRDALPAAIAGGAYAVCALQQQLRMGHARLPGVRVGNINTPRDLQEAGIDA